MQITSAQYKKDIKKVPTRNQSYIQVSIGVINQEAQRNAYIADRENYSYYSNFTSIFENYDVDLEYATLEDNFHRLDGTMFLLPEEDSTFINTGLISGELLGPIRFSLPYTYDIKGLTIHFAHVYPVDFVIKSNNNVVQIVDNKEQVFVTEEIFDEATYIEIAPTKMSGGKDRLHIHKIFMGVGIYFNNKNTQSFTKTEEISPINESLPMIDVQLTAGNTDLRFDIENDSSSINFFESGQELTVEYGYDLDSGEREWIKGGTYYLSDWQADEKTVTINATDRFATLESTYYKGWYYEKGITLYDLALDVLQDAKVDERTFYLDPYLKDVIINNPIPPMPHKEALQLIANVGRSFLYQDRDANIIIKSDFIPESTMYSNDADDYSKTANVIEDIDLYEYVTLALDFHRLDGTQVLFPEDGQNFLETGYVSKDYSKNDGYFDKNPTVYRQYEATWIFYSIGFDFGGNPPEIMRFRTYRYSQLIEEFDYINEDLLNTFSVEHEFLEIDYIEIEFTKTYPYNQIILNQMTPGNITDYHITRKKDMYGYPTGSQLPKVKELHAIRTIYTKGTQLSQLAKETIEIKGNTEYTFYFTEPCYGFQFESPAKIEIIDYSLYFITVLITGYTGNLELKVNGYKYETSSLRTTKQLNLTGSVEEWENPLVSTRDHAELLSEWVADYLKSDKEYEFEYRGDPRIDADDVLMLQTKNFGNRLLKVEHHSLSFAGGLKGNIRGRRYTSVD